MDKREIIQKAAETIAPLHLGEWFKKGFLEKVKNSFCTVKNNEFSIMASDAPDMLILFDCIETKYNNILKASGVLMNFNTLEFTNFNETF